ncbi:MAG: 3-deoxy-D-manno-octulosonic acid kinase [Steroidobacteraceae bacterium]
MRSIPYATDRRGQIKYNTIYNPNLVRDAGPELFEPSYWYEQQGTVETVGGRGSVLFIRDGERQWVLRHYRRGGLIGKLLTDQYLWLGAEATRSFREWRLLAHLHALSLPVPTPVAARYVRSGPIYRADLLTVAIPDAQTLTQRLQQTALSTALWQHIGITLARFHAIGVHHADLNANNIILDAKDEVHVLDFDRGRIREVHDSWIQAVLQRLLRSLHKLQGRRGLHFTRDNWQALRRAHDQRLHELLTRVS